MEIFSVVINGKSYTIKSIPFEDKSEKDKQGFYEYYYKGINFEVMGDDHTYLLRKYHDEDTVFIKEDITTLSQQQLSVLKELATTYFKGRVVKAYNPKSNVGYTEI